MPYKIGLSGGSKLYNETALEKAREVGREIAKSGNILVTGATIGVSYAAVQGAKEVVGKVLGVSPAKDEKEQVEVYGYPIGGFDEINFTGIGLNRRNVEFIEGCDGVIIVGGAIGTLNELTVALTEDIPLGILKGTGGVAEHVEKIIEICQLKGKKIVYSKEPKELVYKLIELLK